MFDFSKQTVVVSGGTRGIGRAIAEEFLRAGAKVVATYKGNDAAAAAFLAESVQYEGRLETAKCDVTSAEQVEALFASLEERHGTVEVLVNNSGIRKDGLLLAMKEVDWDDVLDTNLKGTFLMCKAATRLFLKSRYGRIVNVASISGLKGIPGQTNYSASKAGQIALTRSLSKEVARSGITVNCVAPGFVETELTADLAAKTRDYYLNEIPVRRFGTAAEIAHCVLFLAGREASYVTGATLAVAGGLD